MNNKIKNLVKAEATWSYDDNGKKINIKGDGFYKWNKIEKDQNPNTSQFIIRTGKKFNLIVVDVDVNHKDKNGNLKANGEDTLFEHNIDMNEYPTLTFQSKRGFHYFYLYSNDIFDTWSSDFLQSIDMISNQSGNGWFVFHDVLMM